MLMHTDIHTHTHTYTYTGGDPTQGTLSTLDSSTDSPAGRRDAGAGGDRATVGGGAGGAGPGEIEVRGREGGTEWKEGRGSG